MNFEKRVRIYRGDIEESSHNVAACAVNSAGKILYNIGSPDLIIYPRSAIKFIQAIALVETGAAKALNLNERHISLACASHEGESFHIDQLLDWLARIGLKENDLACGRAFPSNQNALEKVLNSGEGKRRIYHECSGKHLGFLTMCKHLEYPIENYYHFSHPVQQIFASNLRYFMQADDNEDISWAVDGCGFPAPALKLQKIAYGMARFADIFCLTSAKARAVKQIQKAISWYPQYMSGSQNLAALLIRASEARILVKYGGEGVYVGVVPGKKIGLALKVADGAARAAEYALLNMLDELNLISPTTKTVLANRFNPAVNNSRDEITGRISHV